LGLTFAQDIATIIAMNKAGNTVKIIEVYNKNAGVTYVYEDTAYWDSEKKQGRHRRKCIGKKGSDGRIIYNEYYLSRQKASQVQEHSIPVVSKTTLLGQNLILIPSLPVLGWETFSPRRWGRRMLRTSLDLPNARCVPEDRSVMQSPGLTSGVSTDPSSAPSGSRNF